VQPADLLAIILALAALIGCVNHLWIKLPPAIGMLLCSLVLSGLLAAADRLFHLHVMWWFRGNLDQPGLSRIFLNGALALLLFAGSLHVDARQLSRRWPVILLLATASVILSTVVFGAGAWVVFGLTGAAVPLVWCFILGAVLAPTDAVIVEALLRQVSIPARLRAAIVGESLFNDGAGVVLFLTAVAIAQGQASFSGRGEIVAAVIGQIAGGGAIGLSAGTLAALLIRRIDDEGLQLTISLAVGLGSYRLAGLADASGPIAVVVAGLSVASLSPQFASDGSARSSLVGFWSLLDQLFNSMLFLLMGLEILALAIEPRDIPLIVLAIPLALAARAISVAAPALLTREGLRDKAQGIAVLTWAGLRGGISLALALTLPPSPWRATLLAVVYAVVVFTIVVQGLTMPALLRRVFAPAPRP
jgi:CPA1 family monovalent cation:H+ antiporter